MPVVRGTRTLSTILVAMALCNCAALADYVDPPAWESDTDFTHQSWDFLTGDVPLDADNGTSNAFGVPRMTDDLFLYDETYMFWSPDAYGHIPQRYGMWGGMPGGIVTPPSDPDELAMYLTFEVPNSERPAPWRKELWIQVVYWGCIERDGQVITVEIAADPDFQNVYHAYPATADDIETLDEPPGDTGRVYRFTHTFALNDQPPVEYVRTSLVRGESAAIFIDQVSIDTRCIVPGDFNRDEDVDLADYAWFQCCFTGPGGTIASGCEACDLDWDEDVDLDDFAEFEANLTGPRNE